MRVAKRGKTGAAFFGQTLPILLFRLLIPRFLFNLVMTSHPCDCALVSGTNTLRSNDRHSRMELKPGSRNGGLAPRVRVRASADTPWRLSRRQRLRISRYARGGFPIEKLVPRSGSMQLECQTESTARLLHPDAEENSVSVTFRPLCFLGPGDPHQESPLWASSVSIYINNLLPCGCVSLSFRKVSQSFSRYQSEPVSIQHHSFAARASIAHSFLHYQSLHKSHIPLYVQLVCPVSTTHSRNACFHHLRRSGAACPCAICIGRRISFRHKHVQLSRLLRVDLRPGCGDASHVSRRKHDSSL